MKRFIPLILLTLFFSSTNCENILDCIINVRPELKDKTLEIGFVDGNYYDNITAQINNEARDNNYDYYFDVSGRLPRGIVVDYDTYREVILRGVPKESGRFRFTVSLEVVALNEFYYDDFGNEVYDDPLCTDTTSRTYVLVIKD
ncbi:hypothetical protein [Algibacter aquimarinus]|uniref:DUF4377 domain-containing protein n=1 Tax=Algibacter aquimarinus TaxID=1136748 RepID=A0ABP9HLI4_9FLAO